MWDEGRRKLKNKILDVAVMFDSNEILDDQIKSIKILKY